MLAPEAGGDREEKEGIQVRRLYREEAAVSGDEAEPLAGKKPSSEKASTSRVSRRQVRVSYSREGSPQQ